MLNLFQHLFGFFLLSAETPFISIHRTGVFRCALNKFIAKPDSKGRQKKIPSTRDASEAYDHAEEMFARRNEAEGEVLSN